MAPSTAAILGEVIESSTARFCAQCVGDTPPPALGSFVTVALGEGEALAVVIESRCASADPHRRAMAYGLPPDELYRQQPQLRELLTTEFDACLLGHATAGVWRQWLPPHPPRLHSFVHRAPDDAVAAVTASGDWLRTLAAAELGDDLLAAAVRAAIGSDGDPARLVEVGRALARLFSDDYDRLRALLRRIGG